MPDPLHAPPPGPPAPPDPAVPAAPSGLPRSHGEPGDEPLDDEPLDDLDDEPLDDLDDLDDDWPDDAPLEEDDEPTRAADPVDPLLDAPDDDPAGDPLDDLAPARTPDLDLDVGPETLPWTLTASLDGELVRAVLDPTSARTTWFGGWAGEVTLALGPVIVRVEIVAAPVDGDAYLRVGRDVLAGRVLVAS